MADFNASLPVRTEAAGDIEAGVVDSADVRIDPATKSNQTDGSQKSQIVDGANIWDIDASGAGLIRGDVSNPIPVEIVDGMAGVAVNVFATVVAGVPSTPNTVLDFTVTAGKTLRLRLAAGSASGKAKVEIKTGTPSSEVTKAVRFIGVAQDNVEINFPAPHEVAAGDKVLVIITNTDKANQDLYANISGNEV